MNAMDKMIASMLGITPEGMQQMVTDFKNTISSVGSRLQAIEEKQDKILSILEGQINERSSSDGVGGANGRNRNGDSGIAAVQ